MTEPSPAPSAPPTRLRMVFGALATLAVAIGVWALVEWRSAPPPPPKVPMPDAKVR